MHQYLALLILLALALGCQRAPAPAGADSPPGPRASVSAGAEAAARGDALMRAGQYQAAAEQYRRAVAAEPDAVSHRFALGSAYTFLDRRPDAIEQFRWVVTRADPGGDEYRAARRWLVSAGVPVEPSPATTAPGPRGAPVDVAAEPPLVGGRLIGATEWPGINPKVRAVSGEMSLAGIEAATESVKRFRPLRLGARYHFYDLPPGQYRLVVRMAHHPEDVTLWDQKVLVADGTPTELNLTPETARLSPDEFPPPVNE
jgi:hypothetical protein